MDPVSHPIYIHLQNPYSARAQYTNCQFYLPTYALYLLGFYLSLITRASVPNA